MHHSQATYSIKDQRTCMWLTRYRTLTHQLQVMFILMLASNMAMFLGTKEANASVIPNYFTAANVNNATTAKTTSTNQILGYTRDWRLITRNEWGARPPKIITNFTIPASFVILHHSDRPGICRTMDACKVSMRSMQNFHMNSHSWTDIGYSFAVGGDGNVYEGRGYGVVGAHAPNYNSRSIGLLLIGNFMEEPPPAPMQQVAQNFIKYSMERGYLRDDYTLYGHRQVRSTKCPGDALFEVIKEWPHWQELN
ncbi:peptidoglycan-recognition protein SB1-like [Eurosta solidaginis]|uniref:peptidoglycan-recognition protein SB1-like n=1 Tax=Eurosta solidaginis TaxID=178769 RepID=UPI0035312658